MEAITAWRWWNLTETLVPSNKQPLRLNLDETPVRCYYASDKGLRPRDAAGPNAGRLRRISLAASKQWQRMALTHVAILADNVDIQRVLPLVILGSDKALQK